MFFQFSNAMNNDSLAECLSLLVNISACEDSTRHAFDIVYIVSYSLCVIFFLVLFGIHFTIRYTFHPVFSFYISLLVLAYILCDSAIVVYAIFAQFFDDPETGRVLEILASIIYSYILPLVFFATVERLAATILVMR
ncbi:hypothetical protein PMAYCL1PPCAC_21792, partial [Pristionchus mayeri]